MKQNKQRTYIIVGLCAILVIMAVGFAAFASQLQINGTSNITSNWSILITNITPIIPAGSGATDNSSSCDESGTPKACGNSLTANVSANLVSPGDSITYRIEVTNKGSLNAVLSNINLNAESSSDIGYYVNKDKNNTTISDSGYRLLEEDGILNPAGDTNNLDKGYVYLTIYYKEYPNQPSPTGDAKTVGATAIFDFVQSNSEAPTPAPALVIDQTFVPQYYEYGGGYTIYQEMDANDMSTLVTDPSELGKNYYFGHDVDTSTNTLTAHYVCFVMNGTQYCVKYDDYTGKNEQLLESLRDSGIITCDDEVYADYKCDDGEIAIDLNGGPIAAGRYPMNETEVFCAINDSGMTECLE